MRTRWLPKGYLLTFSNRKTDIGWRWQFIALADGIPRRVSEHIYSGQRSAYRAAREYLRTEALNRSTTGWTSTGCAHAVVYDQTTAFCGTEVGDEPDLSGKESQKCGRCEKILEGLEEEEKP